MCIRDRLKQYSTSSKLHLVTQSSAFVCRRVIKRIWVAFIHRVQKIFKVLHTYWIHKSGATSRSIFHTEENRKRPLTLFCDTGVGCKCFDWLTIYLLASPFVCVSYIKHCHLLCMLHIFHLLPLANFAFKLPCIVTPGSITSVWPLCKQRL